MNSSVLPLGQTQFSMARETAKNEIVRALLSDKQHDRAPRESRLDYAYTLRLLDHFLTDDSPWIGAPECQKALQKHGIELGRGSPHLLHAILAFSASHMYHLVPDRRFKLASVHHYDRLVSLFSTQMSNVGTGNVVPLFGSCTLLSMLSYLAVAYDDEDQRDTHQCDWNAFRSLGGARAFQSAPALEAQLSTSVWLPLLQESDLEDEDHTSKNGTWEWSSTTMKELGTFCGVVEGAPDEDNVYVEPIRRLNGIVRGKMDTTKIGQLMRYHSKLSSDFYNTLETYDPKAMLIIAYWHACLSQVGQWWAVATGLGACQRMCAYLSSVGREDLRELLRFPLETCGLNLVK